MTNKTSVRQVESASVLRSQLGSGSLLLGDIEVCSVAYYVDGFNYPLGILAQGTGVSPSLADDHDHAQAWVGFDDVIVLIDSRCPRAIRQVQLDGYFYEVPRVYFDGGVLVWHELGLLRLDRSGTVVWRVSTDILASCEIVDGVIELRELEGGQKLIHEGTGEVIQ